MTKPTKVFEQLSRDPSRIIAFKDFVRLLTAFGFVHERTTGSHQHYVHPDVPFILTINPGKDAKRYQVRRLLDIVEEFGLSMDR